MMRRLMTLALMAGMALTALAQSTAVNVTEQKPAKSDASLGTTSVAVFLSKNNNLVISTNDPNDRVGLAQRQANGQYQTEVTCDMSKGGGSKRTYTVVIKNTSLQTRVDKVMQAGKRFTFLVEEAEHMLTFWWPETKNVAYTGQAQGKSCVEFQAPADLQNLTVKYSDNMGARQLPTRSERGMAIVGLEIDCKTLKQTMTDKLRLEGEIAQLQQQFDQLHATNDANAGKEGYDIEAGEKKEEELTARIEELQGKVPNIYIILTGKSCNQVPLSEERIRQLQEATYKLTVGVNDAMAHEPGFEDLLSQAREYYRTYPSHGEYNFYDAARIAYNKTLDCAPDDQKDAIRAELDTLLSIRRNIYLIDKAEEKAQGFEKEKGFTDPDVYKYLAGAVRFCDRILTYHPEITPIHTTKQRIMARVSQHPSSKTQVTETVTRQRQAITGTVSFKNQYRAIPFAEMRVYATTTAKIANGKSHVIGKVNADGTFSVIKPDGKDYIYVSGEKDNAHYIGGTSHIDIIVK
ncbi:MAG: hypothetical protein IJU11_01590 [Prevotella sp.]|nr:hypothetical protein [Prevotella sp.]